MPFLHSLLALCLAGLLSTSARAAGDDHGHDHGPAAPAAGVTQPRFAAVSDAFELVGVLDGRRLTLYLDRATDNAPVADATVELEIGGATLRGEKQADGTFRVVLPGAASSGVLPVTATVTVGEDVDLLVGELDVHGDAHADGQAHAPSATRTALWVAGAGAALVVLAWTVRHRTVSRRSTVGSDA